MSPILIAWAVGSAWGVPFELPTPPAVHPEVWSASRQSDQPTKVWVYFRDKGPAAERAAAMAQLRQSYHPRAIRRRLLRGAAARAGSPLFTERDLPVFDPYVRQALATGLQLTNTSRWLNAASGWADRAALERLVTLSCVERITPVRPGRRMDPPIEPQPLGRAATVAGADPFYGFAYDQLWQLQLPRLHSRGFTGEGIIIGVLDTGFSRIHEAFQHPQRPLQVVAEWDFVDGDANTAIELGDPGFQHAHGTWILGTIAAYQPGQLIGAAYGASYILCKTEDTQQEIPLEEDNYVAALEFVELHGGDIATSSLGYYDWYTYWDLDGQTAVTTQAVNIATEMGIICLTAVGNRGQTPTPSLIAPSDALDVISVGAVNFEGGLSSFSSNGPTVDGRVKPEVLALGEGANSVSESLPTGLTGFLSGTSISTPLVAGVVACILQARPDWTVAQMRRNLFETAGDWVVTGETDPDDARGYGIVNSFRALQDCNGNDQADLIDIAMGAKDGNGNSVPDQCESFADLDADGDVDPHDYKDFLLCFAGPADLPLDTYVTHLECTVAFSVNGVYVDLAGAAAFQNEYTGSVP